MIKIFKNKKLTFNLQPLIFVRGFTLVELLVVMAIIGILASLGVGSYMNAQLRGRDAQRKSDLKQISHSLELYYADYGRYPDAISNRIGGCPSTTSSACAWGTGSFTDGKTTYFKNIPTDPVSNYTYYYRVLSSNQKYQLFAYLENTKDSDLIIPATSYVCGTGKNCNFAITSANTNASEP